MLRCTSLGSGSKGNATIIATQNTCLLVDCGFGLKELSRRMLEKGLGPKDLTGILVTHEHSDHASGVRALAKRYQLPVWLTRGCQLHKSFEMMNNHHILHADEALTIGDIQVLPFRVPHDAREPVQFIFSHEDRRIALLTDLGHITPHILEMMSSIDILLLEFNHDTNLLKYGDYPKKLKDRVSGHFGHLNNQQAISLLKQVPLEQIKHVVAMHLSEKNNRTQIVSQLLETQLGDSSVCYQIADQLNGFPWLTVC